MGRCRGKCDEEKKETESQKGEGRPYVHEARERSRQNEPAITQETRS